MTPFAEPPATQYDLRFSLLGVPVRIHPFFWLVGLLLGLRGDLTHVKIEELLIWIAVLFVSILVHEFGHAAAVIFYRDRPWIILYGFGGLCCHHPSRHDPWRQIVISFAGPAAGFLLLGFVLSAIRAAEHQVGTVQLGLVPYPVFEPFESANLNFLIVQLIWINFFWGLINLLPIYPLDGGQIAREAFLLSDAGRGVERSLWLSVIAAAGVAVFGVVVLNEIFIALFFGYLAYNSWTILQRYRGFGGGFGGGF